MFTSRSRKEVKTFVPALLSRIVSIGSFGVEMKHLAAYLLAVLGGNTEPSAADVTKIIEAAGGEADSSKIEQIIEQLKVRPFILSTPVAKYMLNKQGKALTELIDAGIEKLGSLAPSGGAHSKSSAFAAMLCSSAMPLQLSHVPMNLSPSHLHVALCLFPVSLILLPFIPFTYQVLLDLVLPLLKPLLKRRRKKKKRRRAKTWDSTSLANITQHNNQNKSNTIDI